jgi:protoporphyrinogen oxidase
MRGGRVPDGRGLAFLRATGAFSRATFDAPDEAVCKELLAALVQLFPGAASAVLFSRVFRVERAQPCFGVGRYRAIANFERIQSELRAEGRRLYFAGDYLMDPSFEGAIASAHRVADAVVRDLSA